MIDSKQLKSINPHLDDINFKLKQKPIYHSLLSIGLLILIPVIVPLSCLFSGLLAQLPGILGKIITFAGTFLLIIGVSTLVVKMYRLSFRYKQNSLKNLKDKRPPVLFLRSFISDAEEDSNRFDRRSSEELLAEVLKEVGPVIAVGQPNEEGLPFLGATRIYFPQVGDQWKENVVKLMSRSKLVVIDVDDTDNVMWELENARQNVKPTQLLLSFFSKQQSGAIEPFYNRIKAKLEEKFPTKLPPFHPNLYMICFSPIWTAHPVVFEPQRLGFFKIVNNESYVQLLEIENVLTHYFKSNGII